MEDIRANLALEAMDAPNAAEQENESFSTLDFVRELYLNSEEQKKLEGKKIRLLKTAVTLLSVMSAVVFLSCALIVPAFLNAASETSKALTVVQKVDVETIAKNIDALALQAKETLVQVGSAVEVLNDLDMESLNATIGELKIAVDSFTELDIATLNKTISNLNATVEPFARYFGSK